ncbi:hypothetical protein EBU58_09270, partial [bacterium]|nr:hypothetical protein [bacterium]
GSYSDANHSLPFLTAQDIAEAQAINEATIQALKTEFDQPYQGILYGGFMRTPHGVKLIESVIGVAALKSAVVGNPLTRSDASKVPNSADTPTLFVPDKFSGGDSDMPAMTVASPSETSFACRK